MYSKGAWLSQTGGMVYINRRRGILKGGVVYRGAWLIQTWGVVYSDMGVA